jgi:DNA-binding transcriptional ArsR family regulator
MERQAISRERVCKERGLNACEKACLNILTGQVGELAEACDLPSHMASEHLGLMRDRGLLQSERQGRYMYYRIAEEGLASIMQCIEHRFGAEQ